MNHYSRYLNKLKYIYYDLNGKFTVQLERGNNYILVAYHYDANSILTTPLKKITGPWILNRITKIYDKLIKWGLTPKLHIMDNEVSEDQNIFLENRYTVTISATIHASEKRCRTVSENIQGLIHCLPMHCVASLPFIMMGPHIIPSHYDNLNSMAILTQLWNISIQTGRRRTLFWTHNISTIEI